MSTEANVALMRRIFDEISSAGTMTLLMGSLAEDVTWKLAGTSKLPFSGSYHGIEGVKRYWELVDKWLHIEQLAIQHYLAQDDRVVVVGDETVRIVPTGETYQQEWTGMFTLRDGKIVHILIMEVLADVALAMHRKMGAP